MPILVLVGLCFLISAAEASAVATGVCKETPEAGTKRCKAGTYFAAGAVFVYEVEGGVSITNGTSTLECKKSTFETALGANPNNVSAVSIEVKGFTFGECKVGKKNCTVKSPDAKETKFPWSGALQWSTFGTTGPNGSLESQTVSINAECEKIEEVVYFGGGKERSISGKFFNADTTNKPLETTRAVVQFNKVEMTARRVKEGKEEAEEKGLTLSGIYFVKPTAGNVYISNG